MGYIGIFIMNLIEGSCIPVPTEATMIPAGYMIFKKKINFYITIFSSLLGTVIGALLSYIAAYKIGRELFIKYSKYFLIKETLIKDIEVFFIKYGKLSVFIGRLLPGARHMISLPAGLAGMNIITFCTFTMLGSAIWLCFLIHTGYTMGRDEDNISRYVKNNNIIVIHLIIFYYRSYLKKRV